MLRHCHIRESEDEREEEKEKDDEEKEEEEEKDAAHEHQRAWERVCGRAWPPPHPNFAKPALVLQESYTEKKNGQVTYSRGGEEGKTSLHRQDKIIIDELVAVVSISQKFFFKKNQRKIIDELLAVQQLFLKCPLCTDLVKPISLNPKP